jgi:hypothetical protein
MELPADDDEVMLASPYHVDDITENENCEMHVKVMNISTKVAAGFALPFGPRPTYHCSPVLDGYVVVGVDEVVKGFEQLKLDFPAGERDLNELGESIKGNVLWRKEYIVIPNWKPMPPTSQCSNPAQSLHLSHLRRVCRLRRDNRLCRLHCLSRLHHLCCFGKSGRAPPLRRLLL